MHIAAEYGLERESDVLPASLEEKVHDQLCQTVISFCHDSQMPFSPSNGFGAKSPNSLVTLTPTSSSSSPGFKYEDVHITVPADF